MSQRRPLNTYRRPRQRKVSLVDWSQCFVTDGDQRDLSIFESSGDSTHGMCLRKRNRKTQKEASPEEIVSISEESDYSFKENIYSSLELEKSPKTDFGDLIKPRKEKIAEISKRAAKKTSQTQKTSNPDRTRAETMKPSRRKDDRKQGRVADKKPDDWPELIDFSDIEKYSLVISDSLPIEGALDPVLVTPEEVDRTHDADDDHRLQMSLRKDPVPVLCSTPQIDDLKRVSKRAEKSPMSNNFYANISMIGQLMSTIDLSYHGDSSSLGKDSFKASCRLGDSQSNQSDSLPTHNLSGGCSSSGSTSVLHNADVHLCNRLAHDPSSIDNSMDLFGTIECREDDVSADELIDETEAYELSRIVEEEDEANGEQNASRSLSGMSEDSMDDENVVRASPRQFFTPVTEKGVGACGTPTSEDEVERGDDCNAFVTPPLQMHVTHPLQMNVTPPLQMNLTPPLQMHLQLQDALEKSARNFKEMLTPMRLPRLDKVPTFGEKVLFLCDQTQPLSFASVMPPRLLKTCSKIGEGVYGEVFRFKQNGEFVAVKIIPIEGQQLVNGEKQKTFEEILPEIIITKELSSLRDSLTHRTENFVFMKKVSLVRGSYPKILLDRWDNYDSEMGSENDRPDIFGPNQLFIIFEFEESGKSLENFEPSSLDEVKSILTQVTTSLAVAEESLEFEHRDLHWGNVLIRSCDDTSIDYHLNGTKKTIATNGVKATIIDFTLSRLRKGDCTVFTDLSTDETLFSGKGDYQFEIYRLMRKENCDNWGPHHPYTNVLWVHYLFDKMLDRYMSKVGKNARQLRPLKNVLGSILDFKSAADLMDRCSYF